MDKIDACLLDLLQKDSRCTISELSKKINLSRPSIAERISRLVEKGVIEEFTARVSLKETGKNVLLFIEVSSLKVPFQTFEEKLANNPDIIECHRISGKSDYILKAAVKNIEDMTLLINKLLPFCYISTSIVLGSPIPYRHVVPELKD